MDNLKLSSPWQQFVSEIETLFEHDDEVTVLFDNATYTVKLYVDNAAKAEALAQLMPSERVFGNITVKVEVVPSNSGDILDVITTAFAGNPALTGVFETPETLPFGGIKYVMFAPEVVQYYNDDMSDAHGLCSTLYADIARDVFGDKGVYYCTDKK